MKKSERTKFTLRDALRLRRPARFVWESGPGWTAANAALVLVQGALPLCALYLTKLVIDAAAAGFSAPDKAEAFRHTAILIGLMAAVALAGALCRLCAGLVREAQTQAVTDHMYDVLHAKSIAVDLEYYEDPGFHDTLHRSQREAPGRPTRIVNDCMDAGRSAVSLVAMAAVLCTFSPVLAALLFVATVPGAVMSLRHSRRFHRWHRERTPAERRAWYFSWLLTGDAHAKEIRLFDLGPLFIRRFRELRAALRAEMLRLAARRSLADLASQLAALAAVYGASLLVAYRTVQGSITLGGMVMYFQALQRGQDYLRQALGGLTALYEDQLFLTGLYEFLDLKRRVAEPAHPKPVPRPMRDGIVFDRVSFRYPGAARNILEEVTLAIRPGQMVALVGENGSGKTTLIKLLCRLYDPTSGRITLDGADLREFDTTALRREISVIFQDYARYHLTAGENIHFGNLSLPPDDERILAAARQSGADEVIAGLPRGYRTTLGKWFDAGEELSEGQWQKLALARVCVRDSQIVILDEPTSALDAAAEYALFRSSRRIIAGRAALVVSHRFSTVRTADLICVLEKGRIIEHGSHAELMRTGGLYARMFELQAGAYLK